MCKGCLYTDLDDLRTQYRLKGCNYARRLQQPLKAKNRLLYEKKLYDYQLAYNKIDKLLQIYSSLDL